MRKTDFNVVKEEFKRRGYKLLSDESDFKDSKSQLEYICPKHEDKGVLKIRWVKMNMGRGCRYCGIEKQAKSQRASFSKVIESFDEIGLVLLSKEDEYKNKDTKLRYICPEHDDITQYKTYSSARKGHGCPLCDNERKRGHTSPSWKGGITPLVRKLRNVLDEWKFDILKSSGFTCEITGRKGGDLEVHHLYSFDLILDEAMHTLNLPIYEDTGKYTKQEMIDIEKTLLDLHYKYGGVVLTKEVHKEFHSVYGYGNNTPEQFYEFAEIKRRELNESIVI